MGNCTSKSNPVVEEAAPAPHPQARKLTLIAVPLDQQEIPLDLAGIDSGGLKGAMQHRGLETEHWALKVDPAAGTTGSAQVFDISIERGRMVASAHDISSPLWRDICRRQELGWTIWSDHEILNATKMLVQARPKYDGRNNNLQQLARILARHIQYTPPAAEASSSASMLKPSAPPSQSTDETQQRTDRSESSDLPNPAMPAAVAACAGSTSSAASSNAGSVRQGGKSRSRLSNLPKSSSTAELNEAVERPPYNRASLSEQQAQRLQAARRSSAFAGSPLNPEHQPNGRARTQSDVSQVHKRQSKQPREQGHDDRRRSTLSQAHGQSQSQSRRKSQIPSEWAGDAYRSGDSQARGSMKRMSRRDSQMSFAPPPPLPHNGTWSPAFALPTPPMMAMPMNPYDMPAGMSPYMGGYGMPMSGSMQSLHGQPQVAMARPMSFYGPPMSMPWVMPPPPLITMLGPPASPGGYNNGSMHSSMVPTPPESPMPPFDQAANKRLHAPPVNFQVGQSRTSPRQSGQHSRHASAR